MNTGIFTVFRRKGEARKSGPKRAPVVKDGRVWRKGIVSHWGRWQRHADRWDGKTALVAPAAQPKRW